MKNKSTKYLLLLFFFFIALVFIYTLNKGDTYVNFGFSYAIAKGEIPYKDFNLVITPFAPFLYSIGLIIKKSILIYFIEQSILLTVLFYLLEKILNKKVWIFLLGMLLPYPIAISTTIFPGYNFLLFFLLIILYYLEKNNRNDLLIGIVLGLMFCTKQTVGLILLLPSFSHLLKNKTKLFKRIIGFIIPTSILLIYLLITKSLSYFINLCFLGLFDFGSKNHYIDPFYITLLILGILYLLYRINKDKKEITNYEFLLFLVISIPIIDYYHVSLFFLSTFFLFLTDYSYKKELTKQILIMLGTICIIWMIITKEFFQDITISNNNNFELTITSKKYNENSKELQKYLKQLNKKTIYLLRGSENYFYKIINNENITYYDLPNYGNYGYNGVEIMKSKIKQEEDVVFVLDKELISSKEENQQYIKELAEVVKNNSQKIKIIGQYNIYIKK